MNQTEIGGYPVDPPAPEAAGAPEPRQHKALDGGRPQNTGIADQQDTAFDGGRPGSRQDGPLFDGGRP